MKRFIIVLGILLILAGCSDQEVVVSGGTPVQPEEAAEEAVSEPSPQEEEAEPPREEMPSLPPVETQPANTNYPPAFEGQTRAPGMQTQRPIVSEVLREDLLSPWGIASSPDGRLFITEKEGYLRIVSLSGEISSPIGGFPPISSAGQGGLLDLAFSPDYEEDRRIYFTFSEQGEGGTLTAAGYGVLSEEEDALEDFRIIYRALPFYASSGHYGSRLAFAPDGSLFISTGDRQSDQTRELAQSVESAYGTILRIDKEGNPLEPVLTGSGALPEIYSYGHRNVQGMDFHPQTGDLYISEMGPRGGDELNLILPGANYGWPLVSFGIEYSGAEVAGGLTELEGTEQPIYYWDPVLAPSGMAFYDGDLIPEWKNDLFIGGLRGSHIARIRIENQRVIGEERLLEEEGERFRDLTVGADGALYAVTDAGKLYRIAPSQ